MDERIPKKRRGWWNYLVGFSGEGFASLFVSGCATRAFDGIAPRRRFVDRWYHSYTFTGRVSAIIAVDSMLLDKFT
ncbi:MAG: hypothetical protein GF363_08905 [Chitinivibrionales bacterium]|nr:hypothetical protein [Chitinivibrionales bacterium]